MGNAGVRSALTVMLLFIILLDAAVSQDRSWFTVNNMSVSSFIASSTDTSLDVICNTEVSGTVQRQEIYRAQNFTYEFFNGSNAVTIWSDWFRLCISDTRSGTTPEYACIMATQTTRQQMSSGIRLNNLSPFTSALFLCISTYDGLNGRGKLNSTLLRIIVDGPVNSSLSAFGINNNGSQTALPSFGINNNGSQTALSSASGIFNVSQYKMVLVVCYINSFNEVPSYQMFLNGEDVTYAVNTSGSYGNMSYITDNFRLFTDKTYASIKYQIRVSYQFSSVTCSNWTIVCTSWAKSSPSQQATTQARFSSSFCTPQGSTRSSPINTGIEGSNGSHPINRVLASQMSISPVNINTIGCGLVSTFLIKL